MCVRVGKICVRCPLLGLSSASATIARGHTQRKSRVEILGCCVRWIDRVCFGLIWFGARPLVRALEAKATLRSMCMYMLPAAARIDLARSPSPMPTTTQPPAGVLFHQPCHHPPRPPSAPLCPARTPPTICTRRPCGAGAASSVRGWLGAAVDRGRRHSAMIEIDVTSLLPYTDRP